jgi:predicted SprT family Zn-dependent metalloprotease
LQSPSKAKTRIPTPPNRPSLDAFWNANTVNDWNEQHSPKKILKSPRKLKFLQDDSQQSPTSSPRKLQSPFKRTKAELEAKKTFETTKHGIAEDFLAELDTVVTHGKVGELAASTGGVRFIWNKTLNSTAGRANWRRETIKTRHTDGTSTTTHKHHASIELAEKVIDDEERLVNVIAHEFCHLANFMVSGIKDQPHGRQFKEWGRKCTTAFSHKGVQVTTKHTFEIEYKYIWQCSNEECGVEFKRHSKSIDPKRHTCGSCRSKLVQIKPVPRKTGEGGGNGTGYAAYVKENFASVKRNMPGASQKLVMQAVAMKYRQEKQRKESSPADGNMAKTAASGCDEFVGLDNVTKAFEVITIKDD